MFIYTCGPLWLLLKKCCIQTSRISPVKVTQTHTLKIMAIGESSIWQLSTQPEDINKETLERDARFLFITTQSIVTEMSGSRSKNFQLKRTPGVFFDSALEGPPVALPRRR